jgi:hypothetical protein
MDSIRYRRRKCEKHFDKWKIKWLHYLINNWLQNEKDGKKNYQSWYKHET